MSSRQGAPPPGCAAGAPRPALKLGSTLGKAEEGWQILAYGFDVDPGMPGFIKRTTKLFKLSEDDVSVAAASVADGDTVYSTTDDTRASKLAVGAHIDGGVGPFSAAASMEVTKDADHEIKTARLDVTKSFNKFAVTSNSVLRTLPQTRLEAAHSDYLKQLPVDSVDQIPDNLGIFYARAANLGGLIRKSYTMQATADDTQSGLTAELSAQYHGLVYRLAAARPSARARTRGATARPSP